MKLLIIVRHGQYGFDYHLNTTGQEQMQALAEKLKLLIRGASTLIFTSPADRTWESAEILGAAFGIRKKKIEEYEALRSEDSNKVFELVASHKDRADVLILVTHFGEAKYFPTYFAEKEWKVTLIPRERKNGEATALDCLQQKRIQVA